MSLHTILRECAGSFSDDEFRTSPSYAVARARHHFFYRALTETGLAYGQIALAVGVRSPSVIYGAAAHAARIGAPIPRGRTYRWHHVRKLQK